MTSCQTPATTVYYEENAQLELISTKGTRILIDVFEPSKLSRPPTESDILLTTHTHPDHINYLFYTAFKGKQLFAKEGEIIDADVRIRGIFGAHNEGDSQLSKYGSNYIFIIDMDGLRIVHFGDLGQETLTPEQMSALGKVDLAVMQFDNIYSQMNVENKKGFRLMNQVVPPMIIPTHNSNEAAKYARSMWPCLYLNKKSVRISKVYIPKDTHMLFLGENAKNYAEITNATEWMH